MKHNKFVVMSPPHSHQPLGVLRDILQVAASWGKGLAASTQRRRAPRAVSVTPKRCVWRLWLLLPAASGPWPNGGYAELPGEATSLRDAICAHAGLQRGRRCRGRGRTRRSGAHAARAHTLTEVAAGRTCCSGAHAARAQRRRRRVNDDHWRTASDEERRKMSNRSCGPCRRLRRRVAVRAVDTPWLWSLRACVLAEVPDLRGASDALRPSGAQGSEVPAAFFKRRAELASQARAPAHVSLPPARVRMCAARARGGPAHGLRPMCAPREAPRATPPANGRGRSARRNAVGVSSAGLGSSVR